MAINTYLSIITLKVNGLNAPFKRYRVAEWIRKYTHAVYKTPTSERKIHTDQRERDGKIYFMQMKTKKSLGDNPYI